MCGRRRSGASSATDLSNSKRLYLRVMNSRPMHAPLTMQLTAVFFAFVAALGLFLLFFPSGSAKSGTPVAAPTAPAAPTTAPPQTADAEGYINGCATQEAIDVPPELVATTEFQTTWTATGQMSVPSSSTGGPGVAGPPAHCFTRTPEGALYAIATFVAEMADTNSNEERISVITQRSLQDSNFDTYVKRLASEPPVTGEPLFSVSGYRWQDYSSQRAVVEIRVSILSGPKAGTTNSILYGVIWANNDWLMLVPSPDTPLTLPDAQFRTFHPWGDR